MHRLERFKNLVMGGPCFVCGKGPSAKELVDKGSYTDGIVTIGVNNFEQDHFRTNYTVVADRLRVDHDYGKEGNKSLNTIINSNSDFVFTHYPLRDEKTGNGLDITKEVLYHAEDVLNHDIGELLSKNIIPKCNTSTIDAIGLAIYMGFTQIGVIGFDLRGHPIEVNAKMIDKGCKKLNDYGRKNGIEILNLSPSSLITSFDKISLDQFYDLYIFEVF